MKKVFIGFLVFAYMNCYLGCTTTNSVRVSGSELPETLNQSNDYPLEIVTVDSVKYSFGAKMYRFKSDTLIGMVQENDGKITELVNIALKNIARAEYNSEDVDVGQTALTTLTVFGIVGVITGTIVLILIINSIQDK